MSDRRAARRAFEAEIGAAAPAERRRGWPWSRRRGGDAGLCALLGPSGAGKTVLLDSLERENGLACSHPARLVARPRVGPETTVAIERPEARARGLRLRESGMEPPDGARSALLCLPSHGPADARARRGLLSLVVALAEDGGRRMRLTLCLSKYELLFRRDGRAALWRAAEPRTARDALAWSLSADGPYGFLRPALSALAARRRLWLQPLSGFGFVAGDGGANVTAEGDRRRTEWLNQITGRMPADEPQWRPFLTQDALLLAMDGTPGKLSFTWSDIA